MVLIITNGGVGGMSDPSGRKWATVFLFYGGNRLSLTLLIGECLSLESCVAGVKECGRGTSRFVGQ